MATPPRAELYDYYQRLYGTPGATGVRPVWGPASWARADAGSRVLMRGGRGGGGVQRARENPWMQSTVRRPALSFDRGFDVTDYYRGGLAAMAAVIADHGDRQRALWAERGGAVEPWAHGGYRAKDMRAFRISSPTIVGPQRVYGPEVAAAAVRQAGHWRFGAGATPRPCARRAGDPTCW